MVTWSGAEVGGWRCGLGGVGESALSWPGPWCRSPAPAYSATAAGEPVRLSPGLTGSENTGNRREMRRDRKRERERDRNR